ncbi:MAG: chromosome segregation protein SMC [Clostridia bacterium]|nr:chromosome segregation protein SMC [Clostridia bacterium]
MYLKKLEMQGFKSFVDRISLNFGEGITAIVGPNGSGKSNISDAIRWVMGEMSAKSLRGSKMEDVIFSGTDKRKPTGFAEVSLHLDNSSKVFPIEYEDIEVTRRVYRSGESEYFINKASCRLRDVHELFMDTGLGRDGYSIIGQGKIDEVLSGKPEDRRQIFEEAAGISKYKYKKADAERKLAAAMDNLARVSDIASEIEGRIEPLRRQSEKAQKYLTLRDELRVLDINLALITIDETKDEKKRIEEIYKNTSEQAESEEKLLEEYRKNEEAAYQKVREAEDEISKAKEILHEAELIKEKINGEILLLQNTIKLCDEEEEKAKEESARLSEEISFSAADKVAKEDEIAKLHEEEEKTKKEIEDLNARVLNLSGETDSKNETLSALSSEALTHAREADSFKSKIETLDAIDANYDRRIESVNASIDEAQKRVENAERTLKQCASDIKEKESERQKAANEIESASEKADNLKAEIASLKAAYNEKSDTYGKCRTRLDVLSDMEKNMEGYGHGVKALLSSDVIKSIKYHGLISKLLSTDEKYTTAVEIGLAAAIQNVVVETEEDAKRAIRYLKENRLGRVTFLPISSVTGRRGKFEDEIKSERGYLGILSDKVQCDAKYREIAENLLGQIALFDNIDNASAAAIKYKYKFKIVTLQGEIFFPGGSITGGSVSRNARLLGREAEIKKLSSECSLLERDMDKTEDAIHDKGEDLKQMLSHIEELKGSINTIDADILKLSGETELQKRIAERETEEAERLSGELQLILDAGKNSEKEKKLLSASAEKALSEEAAVREKIRLLQEEIRLTKESRSALFAEITEKRMHLSSLGSSAELCRMQINTILSEAEAKRNRIKELDNKVLSLSEKRESAKLQIKNKQADTEETESKIASLSDEIVKKAENRGDADKGITELKALTIKQNDTVNALKMELLRLESKMEKFTEKFDSTVEMLWNEYELSFSDAASLRSDIGDIAEAKKRAAELKGQMKRLGHINIDAIEEYKEVSQRYEFLSKQISDLKKAKSELTALIDEVTAAMKEQFSEQFDIISKNFSEVFKELFGGGSAALSLSDPTDILESGIDIDVRPPGKKLQRLSLLSGGEMAFTAIALLFAILKVHPTPFCILDEIEAALDDNNIARFCEYIKSFSKTTQFIVITHRRGTMEAADILYGVTMQEKGISKLLTMKLDEVKFN